MVITALVVVGCIAYSLFAGPVAAAKVQPGNWIYDEAQVLSEETESTLRSYNQSFDADYGSVIAVVTAPSTRGWKMEDYAMEAAGDWELGPNDLILVLDIGGQDAYFLEGGNWPSLDCSGMLDQAVAADFFDGNYDGAVLSLFSAMSDWYAANAAPSGSSGSYNDYGDYYEDYGYGYGGGGASTLVGLILVILVLYIILSAIERSRYNTWYRSYGHMTNPTVLFMPIFPWHRHGSPWFVRMGRRPPPPRGPRGPGGFGGFGPGPGSPRPRNGPRPGSRPGGGNPFGGNSGGFGRGGGFGGGHGGGFGGGGFGGGRGGGFGGGGRGGGFGR